MCFRRILIILLLLSAYFSIFSQENFKEISTKIPVGNKLSEIVENSLHKNGFTPISLTLSSTGQDSFAYNITLEFNATAEAESDGGQEKENDALKTTMIFCFTQEDFFQHEDSIIEFLTYLKSLKKPYSIFVFFSALDFIDNFEHPINGTEVFAESIETPQSVFAIPVTFDSEKKAAIRTGGFKTTAPLWLAERIIGSFFDTHTDFVFETSLSSLYTLGLIKGSERLAYFARAGIPALELSFHDESDIAVLKDFADSYKITGTEDWDQHYFYISFGTLFKPFFINERTLLLSCFIFGIMSILLLCIFSFTGQNGERNKRDFRRAFYLIPITIAASLISLYFGQFTVSLFSRFLSVNLLIQYGIKITFSMMFISVMFMIHEKLKLTISSFAYGYILSVVSIFNIFLFSSQNLLLFIAFIAEYIIIYLSRTTKRLRYLIVFFVLMAIPFMPYAFKIIKYADETEISRHIYSSFSGNLLLSMAIFPFQIMWLRILVFFNVYAGLKAYSPRRIHISGILSMMGILFLIFSMLFLISKFFYKPELRTKEAAVQKFYEEDRGTLSATLAVDAFSGMNTNHVHLSSKEDAVRYAVEVYGIDTPHPIYDSVYAYEVIASGDYDIINFIIPEYPPKDITIDYAADMFTSARIEITAFYKTDESDTFRIERRELKVE